MNDGSNKKMKDIKIGDILFNDIEVISTLIIKENLRILFIVFIVNY